MGTSQSKDKMQCNRYLNGKGPPPLTESVVHAGGQGPNKSKKNSVIKQGNQPDGGEMNWNIERRSLPGHADCDTIEIVFRFDDGIQSDKHPHPGHRYKGTAFLAFLPQNTTGTKILRLLQQAFDHKLLFTVAANSSGEYCVMPADIPLKTLDSGGPGSLGYPDPTYLKTVRKSLKVKGIK
ncbi:E3 ubiquitin-protein ligase DTX3L1 isoform X1 [Puntigrus tetrazona]|uniref:E3 ubiquitin-protein ligase DTX3L1 isoform X1 n=1 Tax=Puntigrus tetrazona TaxID=1606681 RepID=UPI001C8AAD6F|nr:E3 ubiquitin-protein ligase DTX3L1 isoform X1 [Puntigrus tetrazona]